MEDFRQYVSKQRVATSGLEFIKPEDVRKTYSIKDGNPISRIKYFYGEDTDRAKILEQLTQSYFNNKKDGNLPPDLKASDLLELVDWNAPYGKIEIWIYFPPSG